MGFEGNFWNQPVVEADPDKKSRRAGKEPVVVPAPASEPTAGAVKPDAGHKDQVKCRAGCRGIGRRFEDSEFPRSKRCAAVGPSHRNFPIFDPWEGDLFFIGPGREDIRLVAVGGERANRGGRLPERPVPEVAAEAR